MFFGKGKNKESKQGDTLLDYFETGLAHPYLTTPDDEALSEACKAVTMFLTNENTSFRSAVLPNAGSLVGGMRRGSDRNMITRILEKCCEVRDGETVILTEKEKRFIYNHLSE